MRRNAAFLNMILQLFDGGKLDAIESRSALALIVNQFAPSTTEESIPLLLDACAAPRYLDFIAAAKVLNTGAGVDGSTGFDSVPNQTRNCRD